MKVLAFDTSNRTMSVTLAENTNILAEKTINIKRNHSIQLMPAIEELIEEIEWNINEIDRIAVAQGPGSYTGVRIAVTIAKTLAWTISCELVGVSSLKVLAMNANAAQNHLVVPVFDARRENIYTGLYRVQKDGSLKSVEKDRHIHSEKWGEFLASFGEAITFIGEDVSNFKEIFSNILTEDFIYTPENNQLPQASALAKIALDENPVDIHTFTPEYLKLTEAEEKWSADHPDEEGGDLVEKI